MKLVFKAAITAALALGGTGALAQTIPNYGNYQSSDDTFRVGIRLTNAIPNQPPLEAAFHQSKIDDLGIYLDPSEIANYAPAFYTNQTTVQGVFDLRGAPVFVGFGAASPVLTVQFIDPRTNAIMLGKDGLPCAFTYNGLTRQQSYNTFDNATDPDIQPNSRELACVALALSRFSPIDPLVGNPYSLQGSMTRTALDFTESDSLVELGDKANSAGDPWAIGATFSNGSAGRFNMSRIDARINKGWRIFEGNRARLKLDLPFSFTSVKGQVAYTGQVGLGLEMPLKRNTWSLEPRLAYGITYSGGQGSLGHIAQATVASRYVLHGLGRGQLLIGNMVGYSATLGTPGSFDINPDVKAWMFRNGLAYEMPLGLRLSGRATSMRASYGYTVYTGADLINKNFHEATLSFGLRGREDTPKAFRDVIRLNLNTIQAKGFSTYTVGLGFRF